MISPTDVLDPSTEEVIASIVWSDEGTVDDAVVRATAAQQVWAAEPPVVRARALRAFATAVEAHRAELADLEVANAGHLICNALGGADNVRDVLEYSAGGVERLLGDQIPVPGGIDLTFHEPIGVVAVIVPWNFPMVIAGWSLGPALAAGNAVIVKPAELTPLSVLRLEQVGREAGLPDGLFQVLPGAGPVAGDRLVTHSGVGHVVFTGSTDVGRRIMSRAATNITGVTLELGGKSANIIFADADLDAAVDGIPGAAFDNAGQDCCSRSRVLVQRSILNEFLSRLEPVVTGLPVGNPRSTSTVVGPLISARQRDRVASYLEKGTRVAFQAAAPSGPGYWFPPTVLEPVDLSSRAWREEIFGPVIAVAPFDDEQDAIRLANDTPYGLSGSIWTRDLTRALRMSTAVRAGNLSVNSNSSVRYWTPFGGMKQSGIGRELGPHSLAHFTDVKNVFINTTSSTGMTSSNALPVPASAGNTVSKES